VRLFGSICGWKSDRGRMLLFLTTECTLIWRGPDASSEAVELFERRQRFSLKVLQFHS
jgi:hypothetical protein